MNPRTQKGVHLYDNYCHLLCRCRRHSIRSDFLQKLFLTHSVAVVFTTPGIFFVNASQAEPGRNWRSRFSFFFYFDVLKPCMPVGDVLITGRNCGKFMACPFFFLENEDVSLKI